VATATFNDVDVSVDTDDASATVTGYICRITLVKQVLPETDNTSSFAFNTPGTGTLFDGVNLVDDGQVVHNLSQVGSYPVAETVPAGWDLIDRVCTGDADSQSTNTSTDVPGPGTGSATFDVDLGDDITCTFTNRKRGQTTLLKLTNGVQDPNMEWHFTLKGPGVDATDSTPPAGMDFGGVTLIPGETYTMCEIGIPPTWTVEWKVDTNGDGTADTIIPFVPNVNNSPIPAGQFYGGVYDPNYVAFPGQYVNDTRCVNFKVQPGQTLAFEINNSMPGGDPRTIGYWKNWSTCTGGGQVKVAAANGGPDAGWFLVDDLLLSPGYHLGPNTATGGLQLDGNNSNPLLYLGNNVNRPYIGPDCNAAVRILDKSDVVTGKKMASDGAYNMAAQLFAAMLNYSAGAETCPAATTAINGASTLLVNINFNGTGAYLKNGQLYNQAIGFTVTLDQYNNGNLCP
jgi:hypothetical protein